MIGKKMALAVGVLGMTLAASQAHADTDFSFLNKYIGKYVKVKDNKIGDFDLNKVTSRFDKSSSSGSDNLSSLTDRLTKKSGTPKSPKMLSAQKR